MKRCQLGKAITNEQDVISWQNWDLVSCDYVLQVAFNSLFVIGTMFVLDPRLTCLILPLMPLFFVFRRHFESRLRRASDTAQQESS